MTVRRFLNLAFLVAAATIAAACTLTQLAYSNVGLAYNNAPPMVTWMIADYMELSDEQ